MVADSNDGFMNNERLYNMIEKLEKKLSGFHVDLTLARSEMKKYNGLRPAIDLNTKNIAKVTEELKEIKDQEKGKKQIGVSIREWTAWAVAILSLLVTILVVTGVI